MVIPNRRDQTGKNNPNWQGGKKKLRCGHKECSKIFYAYGGKFCSRECYRKDRRKQRESKLGEIMCKICGKTFTAEKGRIYCSHRCQCKDSLAFSEMAKKSCKSRWGEVPAPYMTYRKRALAFYGLKCMKCQQKFLKKELVVHHKDFTNYDSELGNHELENLMVLCRFCHNKLHREFERVHKNYFGIKDIEKGMHLILKGLKKEFGLKIKDQHFIDTPKRVARAYAEIFEGVKDTDKQVKEILSAAFKSDMDQMIVVKDIHVFSMCPHHFLPTEMYIDVAYIPNGYVLGLSKIPRLVEILAKRPVIQEQLTEEITEYLMSIEASGAAARIRGQHFCMRMRGVKKPEAIMVTTSVLGDFREDQLTRNEFLSHIRDGKSF